MGFRLTNVTGGLFNCGLCNAVVRQPAQCFSCGALFCSECLSRYLETSQVCPTGCSQADFDAVGPAFERLMACIESSCKYCGDVFPVDQLATHETRCQQAQQPIIDHVRRNRDLEWISTLASSSLGQAPLHLLQGGVFASTPRQPQSFHF